MRSDLTEEQNEEMIKYRLRTAFQQSISAYKNYCTLMIQTTKDSNNTIKRNMWSRSLFRGQYVQRLSRTVEISQQTNNEVDDYISRFIDATRKKNGGGYYLPRTKDEKPTITLELLVFADENLIMEHTGQNAFCIGAKIRSYKRTSDIQISTCPAILNSSDILSNVESQKLSGIQIKFDFNILLVSKIVILLIS